MLYLSKTNIDKGVSFMKKRLGLLLALLAAGLMAFAAHAETDVLTLPARTKIVEPETFYGNKALKTVKLPYGATSIQGRAFANSSVETAYLPETLTYIAKNAFDGTPLKTVYAEEGTYAYNWAKARGYILVDESNPASDFTYSTNYYGCTITGYVGKSATVRIPHVIDGYRVTGISWFAFRNNKTVKSVSIPNSVTQLGGYAFDGCTALTSVHLPDSLETMDYYTFNGCTHLRSVRLPVKLTKLPYGMFDGCTALGTIDLPESVKTIDSYAFTGCTALKSVALPDGLETINYDAFGGCTALTSIALPKALTSLGTQAFYDCTALKTVSFDPDTSLTEISYGAFYNCAALRTVTLPKSVTTLGDFAFSGCAALERVSFAPQSALTQINAYAFSGCAALTSFTLPAKVTDLGAYAFTNCTALESVALNGQLTTINSYIFKGCEALTTVTMSNTVTAIADGAFSDCPALKSVGLSNKLTDIGESAFYNCDALKRITLPESLTRIGKNAFCDCDALISVRLPRALTSLGTYAFYSCDALKSVSSASGCGLKEISASAFTSCQSLETVSLPASIEAIDDSAFWSCPSLDEVELPASVTSIGSRAFSSFYGRLIFTGRPPVFADDAFSYSMMIAVYPHTRSGWKAAAQKEYGASWLLWQVDNASLEVTDTPLDATEKLVSAETNNANGHSYSTRNNPVNSYLVAESDGGFTRVEYRDNSMGEWQQDSNGFWSYVVTKSDKAVSVERFDKSGKLTWKKTLKAELPLWGGFFSGKNYNFLVFGQTNYDENDDVEIMRVVRYTKNWHRVDAAGAYGENTYIPFDAGSLSMTEAGDFLYIHTCHEMYASSDGLHHQSNMNYQLYVPAMSFVRKHNTLGYVSHSFNQLAIVDGNDVIVADHGDAYPRSILLTRFKDCADKFSSASAEEVTLMAFSGETGDNYTGASMGGLEASSTRYLVAGNSIDQSKFETSSRRNIFVVSVDKSNCTNDGANVRWITTYGESDTRYLSTPVLVRISKAKFLLMWTEAPTSYDENKQVRYVLLNDKGTPTSKIYSAAGQLSDCKPVVSGNTVTWYVTENSKPVFYSISLSNPAKLIRK